MIIRALDTEGTGLDIRHGARPYFITVAEGDDVWSWEAPVNPQNRMPQWSRNDLMEVADDIRTSDILYLQNPRYDFLSLRMQYKDMGLEKVLLDAWDWDRVRDTLLGGHLLASNQPHDLTTMVLLYLRKNIKPLDDALEVATKEALKIVKREFPDWAIAKTGRFDMPSAKKKTWKYDGWVPKEVATLLGYDEDHDWFHVLEAYGNGDSAHTLPLGILFDKLLKEEGLDLIYEERLKLLKPISDHMEWYGLTMSEERTEELYCKLTREAEEYRLECVNLADGEIEDLPVNGVSNALKYVVFDKFGLKSNKKTPKGKLSMDKEVLEHWIATLPETSTQWKFIDNLRKYRKRKTAIGYMNSYKKFWLPYDDSYENYDIRIVYPSYNPTGSDTLRFSSQYPNAQQVSKKEHVNTRYCFGPAPGREWWSIDFSNLELRITAYESGEEEMVKLFEAPDEPPYYGSYHMLVFDTLHPDKFVEYGMDCKKVYADTWYQWTKNGNFAVQYGAVEKSGTADRAYHVKGAQRKIMSRFTEIKKLSKYWIDFANRHGYIETMPDKTVDPEVGYPLYCTRTKQNRVLETVPLSYHTQGTAMWITSKAMVRCHKYLTEEVPEAKGLLISQVHDEIIFEFPVGVGRHHIPILQELMVQGGDDIGVPLGSSVTFHPVTWAESAPFELGSAA